MIESFQTLFNPRSLSFRQFAASVILLPLMLLASGYGLVAAFKKSLLTAEQDALQAQTYILLGGAEPEGDKLTFPEYFLEPRLNTINSGLYAVVTDEDFNVVWRSRSLNLSNFNIPVPKEPDIVPGEVIFSPYFLQQRQYFMLRFDTIWNINGEDKVYRFHTIHDRAPYRKEVNQYKREMIALLFILATFILALQITIMHWGFKPLRKLARRIEQIQSGELHRLDGNYATEIEAVTKNINMLLDSEKKQRSRYKNTLGDLAHSLKTPLSIIRTTTEQIDNQSGKDSEKNIDANMQDINQQVSRMSDIIDHQLRRATMQSTHIKHNEVELVSQIKRLTDALQKVYSEKNIRVILDETSKVSTNIERNDLMELLGNIIENAFKYCDSIVAIDCFKQGEEIYITVSDDGKGVPKENREKILQRGSRADTVRPGQGLGLSVSVDIISSYNGGLSVEKSIYGGAKFVVSLPV